MLDDQNFYINIEDEYNNLNKSYSILSSLIIFLLLIFNLILALIFILITLIKN